MVAKHADTIIVDSKEIGAVWAREFGVQSTFIPYGGDIVMRTGTGRIAELGLAADSYILYVGRLVPENNVDLFIDAAMRLRDRFQVVVVGSAGYGGEIEDRMAALAGHPNVTWLGHVHDQALLTELWANAGTYFHGHSVGGTNPSLLQALGAGAPTVAFDSRFNAEVLAGAGVMVRGSTDQVVHAIERLMLDRSVRCDLSALGRRRVAESYTWDGVCAAYLQAAVDLVIAPDAMPAATEPEMLLKRSGA
jgi:glycosyltransferase involved in cell wall biosynthesis